MEKEIRKGRQTPTQSKILEYDKTYGQEAIDLYNSTERTAQEWQEIMMYDILSYNKDDLFTHTKFGYSVPRRNGKNEIIAIREMWGLVNGEQILHTAHRTDTSHTAWERLLDLLEQANINIISSYRAYGKEHIKVEGGGTINFRTRTSKGGLGQGYDLLVIDEAQEYQDDQESTLKYVVSSSKNPQTLLCGTPPTPVSSGTVFTKLRTSILTGETKNGGWAEWSVENESDPNDKELWYLTNPSLGTIFTERIVQDEITSDTIDFNIQRLGLWIRYNQKSAINPNEWKELQVNVLPKLKGKLFVGIKYGADGTNVGVSVAVKTTDNKIFVECIDCRPIRAGTKWIIDFLKKAYIQEVIIDGTGNQNILAKDMKDFKLKSPILPTVKEVVTANSLFEQSLFNKTIEHKGQDSLVQVVSNCEKRAIGTNGGFGYKSIKPEADIVLLDSIILAHYFCSVSKERKKQKISY